MLDTDICIYLANGRYPQLTSRFKRLKPEQILMSVVTYGELQYGANKSTERTRTLSKLDELIQEIPVEILRRLSRKGTVRSEQLSRSRDA